MSKKLKFAMVCYSNQNRSMEAHKILAEHGFNVVSYGVGSCVRLPGRSATEPNVYEFGTAYEYILSDLRSRPAKEQQHYDRLNLFSMLERNKDIKRAPERWQSSAVADIDVVVTFEERVMDLLLEDMMQRSTEAMQPVLVVNLEVPDNNKEALAAAPQAARLASLLESEDDWPSTVDNVLATFEAETERPLLYTVVFF